MHTAFNNSANNLSLSTFPAQVSESGSSVGSSRFSSFEQLAERQPHSIVIYGGSFDPPHLDHLKAAIALKQYAELVVIIPAAHNPLKLKRPLASDEDRIQMLEAMISDQENMIVLTEEIDRSLLTREPTKTIDTLVAAKNALPETEIIFALGTDCLPRLHEWHRWQELLSIAKFLPISRKGIDAIDWESIKNHLGAENEASLRENLTVFSELGDCSSSAARIHLAQKQGKEDYFFHPKVSAYIREKKLYENL